jgi:hypothetical protein
MNRSILYLGDDDLHRAAAYLGGVLGHAGLAFDYVPSDRDTDDGLVAEHHQLYIISDFPVQRFGPGHMESIVEKVRSGGAGLLMFGGWDSFHGADGGYYGTPIAEALPVEILDEDDRVNCPQPCLIHQVLRHPVVDDLPFDTPPCIGGYNRVRAREGTGVVLTAVRFEVCRKGGRFDFAPRQEADPLLVVGQFGKGRVTTCTTDVAPHWVGGLVDWGSRRLKARAPDGDPIEVGDLYARFLLQMVRWTGRL